MAKSGLGSLRNLYLKKRFFEKHLGSEHIGKDYNSSYFRVVTESGWHGKRKYGVHRILVIIGDEIKPAFNKIFSAPQGITTNNATLPNDTSPGQTT